MTSPAGPASGDAQSRKSSVVTASAVLGTAPACDSRPMAVRCAVGDEHRVVTGLQSAGRRVGEADLGVESTDDQPLAPGGLHRLTEGLILEGVHGAPVDR